MFVIRLPNGNLLVPESAMSGGNGMVIGDAYVEIGPGDADYDRLARFLTGGAVGLVLGGGGARGMAQREVRIDFD